MEMKKNQWYSVWFSYHWFFFSVLSSSLLYSKTIQVNRKSLKLMFHWSESFTHHRSSRWSSLCGTASPWPGRLGWLRTHLSHMWRRYLVGDKLGWCYLKKHPPGCEPETSSLAADVVSETDKKVKKWPNSEVLWKVNQASLVWKPVATAEEELSWGSF